MVFGQPWPTVQCKENCYKVQIWRWAIFCEHPDVQAKNIMRNVYYQLKNQFMEPEYILSVKISGQKKINNKNNQF